MRDKKHNLQHQKSMFKGAPASSFGKAKNLRNEMTKAEVALWEELKGNKFHGYKFRRQHPIQIFILDFYCHKLQLVIEVDGKYHETDEQKIKDAERTEQLNDMGLTVMRFTNEEVLENLSWVLEQLEDFCLRFPRSAAAEV